MYGQGISKEGELLDLGVQLGLVEKSGSWFSMGETRLGQGRTTPRITLKSIRRRPRPWMRPSGKTPTS